MRQYVFIGLILAIMAWSTVRWYVGLCAVIVVAAIARHEDMPPHVAGITGLTIPNLILGWTLLMWFIQRRPASMHPRTSGQVIWVGVSYLVILFVAYAQAVIDLHSIQGLYKFHLFAKPAGFTMDYLINPIRFMIPAGLVLFGLWTRKEIRWLLLSLLMMAGLYAIIVLRNLPLMSLFDEGLYMKGRHRIQFQAGIHANDLALILVQAFWGAVLFARTVRVWWLRWGLRAAAMVFVLTLAMCHSRAGYLAMVLVGLAVGVLYWRRLLLVFPPIVFAAVLLVPSIRNRIFTGFGEKTVTGRQANNWDEISAGRTSTLWPAAIEQFERAPLLGCGRITILRTAMYDPIQQGEDHCPTHPHSAYLEMLIDGGIISFGAIIASGIMMLLMARRLIQSPEGDEMRAVGAICLAGLVAWTVMGISGQSFWPRENTMPSFVIAALTMRLWAFQRAAGNVPGGIRRQTARNV